MKPPPLKQQIKLKQEKQELLFYSVRERTKELVQREKKNNKNGELDEEDDNGDFGSSGSYGYG